MNSDDLAIPPLKSLSETWEEQDRRWQQEETEKDRKIYKETPEKIMKDFIPRKFLDRSLDSFSGSEQVKKVCMEYIEGFECEIGRYLHGKRIKQPGSILFIGKTGCGKTHLAIAIIRELVKRVWVDGVRFTTAPELLLEIRATFRPSVRKYDEGGRCEADTEQDVLDKYSKCDLLVLDDLGSEKVSDFTIQSLYLVIDRRNRDLRPTIVTTNLSLEEIETQIDARMASRLADMTVVRLTMPDYRKKR
jgi:DNA replication protein DnaC